MKKILLFIIISIVTLSAPNPSNNQNSDKSVAELQFKIEQLEKKFENDKTELKKEMDRRIGLTYNIDQIFSTSKTHYEDSIKRVEELYGKSFENYDKTIDRFLGFLGILMTIVGALFAGFKIYDSKKYKELKIEMLEDLKNKKDEIQDYNNKNYGNMMIFINQNIEKMEEKIKNLEEIKKEIKNLELDMENKDKLIKEKLENLNEEYDEKLNFLNKIFDEKMEKLDEKNKTLEENFIISMDLEKEKIKKELYEELNKEFDEKTKDFEVRNIEIIGELKKLKSEIKNEVSLYKKDILCEVTDLKSQFQEVQKRQKQSSEIIEEKEINFDENTEIDKLIIDAKELYKKQDYIGVITTLEGSYLKDDYNINYWLGLANYRLFKYAEAIYYLNIAKDIYPNLTKKYYVNYWLGMAYKEIQDYEEAIKYFKIAKEIAPKKSNEYYSNYSLGMSYLKNQNYDLAKATLKKALELASNDKQRFEINYNLGTNLSFEENSEVILTYLKEAEKYAVTAKEKFDAKFWLGVGNYYCKDVKNSISYLKEAEEINCEEFNLAKGRILLANSFFEDNNILESKKYMEKVLEEDSSEKNMLELKEKIENILDSSDNKTEE